MDPILLTTLLNRSEGETLDFKEFPYKTVGATDTEKSELVKDILAFANAWKETDAYIIIGVRPDQQRAGSVTGVSTFLADHEIQELVNKKTNRPIHFFVETVAYQAVTLDIIRIDRSQERPIYLNKDFGKVSAHTVYLRRGSSTDVAKPDEVAEIGAANVRRSAQTLPQLEAEWAGVGEKAGIGNSISVISTKLVEPSPEKKLERGLSRIIAQNTPRQDSGGRASDIARKLRSPIPGLFETVLTKPIKMEIVTPDPFGVKDEDLLKYAHKLHSRAPLSLRVQNTGTVNAERVRVELRVPAVDGLRFYRQSSAPEKPRASSWSCSRSSGTVLTK